MKKIVNTPFGKAEVMMEQVDGKVKVYMTRKRYEELLGPIDTKSNKK